MNPGSAIDSPARLFLEEEPAKPLHVYAAALAEKAGLLWARRRALARAALAVMALTAALSLLVPNRYTASVTLMPPDSNPLPGLAALMGVRSGSASAGGSLGELMRLRSPGQLYIQIMQSRPLQDRLVARFGLIEACGSSRPSGARRCLAGNTSFSEDRKSGVVSVAVSDRDPQRAARVANGYAEELGRTLAEFSSGAGRREREYFEAQLESANQELGRANGALSQFAGANAALDVPGQSRALVESAAVIEGQLIGAQAELRGLEQIYTGRHERVQQAQARIAELRRQLGKMQGRGASAAAGDEAPATVKSLSALAVPYAELYRRQKIAEAVVTTLSQQYELARLQEARHIGDVQVLDPAEAPERKSSPHRLTLTVAAGLLCLLLGAVRILAGDWWRRLEQENPWRRVLGPAVERARAARSRWRGRLLRLRLWAHAGGSEAGSIS